MLASVLRKLRALLTARRGRELDDAALREKRGDAIVGSHSDAGAPVDWVKPYDEGRPDT